MGTRKKIRSVGGQNLKFFDKCKQNIIVLGLSVMLYLLYLKPDFRFESVKTY